MSFPSQYDSITTKYPIYTALRELRYATMDYMSDTSNEYKTLVNIVVEAFPSAQSDTTLVVDYIPMRIILSGASSDLSYSDITNVGAQTAIDVKVDLTGVVVPSNTTLSVLAVTGKVKMVKCAYNRSVILVPLIMREVNNSGTFYYYIINAYQLATTYNGSYNMTGATATKIATIKVAKITIINGEFTDSNLAFFHNYTLDAYNTTVDSFTSVLYCVAYIPAGLSNIAVTNLNISFGQLSAYYYIPYTYDPTTPITSFNITNTGYTPAMAPLRQRSEDVVYTYPSQFYLLTDMSFNIGRPHINGPPNSASLRSLGLDTSSAIKSYIGTRDPSNCVYDQFKDFVISTLYNKPVGSTFDASINVAYNGSLAPTYDICGATLRCTKADADTFTINVFKGAATIIDSVSYDTEYADDYTSFSRSQLKTTYTCIRNSLKWRDVDVLSIPFRMVIGRDYRAGHSLLTATPEYITGDEDYTYISSGSSTLAEMKGDITSANYLANQLREFVITLYFNRAHTLVEDSQTNDIVIFCYGSLANSKLKITYTRATPHVFAIQTYSIVAGNIVLADFVTIDITADVVALFYTPSYKVMMPIAATQAISSDDVLNAEYLLQNRVYEYSRVSDEPIVDNWVGREKLTLTGGDGLQRGTLINTMKVLRDNAGNIRVFYAVNDYINGVAYVNWGRINDATLSSGYYVMAASGTLLSGIIPSIANTENIDFDIYYNATRNIYVVAICAEFGHMWIYTMNSSLQPITVGAPHSWSVGGALELGDAYTQFINPTVKEIIGVGGGTDNYEIVVKNAANNKLRGYVMSTMNYGNFTDVSRNYDMFYLTDNYATNLRYGNFVMDRRNETAINVLLLFMYNNKTYLARLAERFDVPSEYVVFNLTARMVESSVVRMEWDYYEELPTVSGANISFITYIDAIEGSNKTILQTYDERTLGDNQMKPALRLDVVPIHNDVDVKHNATIIINSAYIAPLLSRVLLNDVGIFEIYFNTSYYDETYDRFRIYYGVSTGQSVDPTTFLRLTDEPAVNYVNTYTSNKSFKVTENRNYSFKLRAVRYADAGHTTESMQSDYSLPMSLAVGSVNASFALTTEYLKATNKLAIRIEPANARYTQFDISINSTQSVYDLSHIVMTRADLSAAAVGDVLYREVDYGVYKQLALSVKNNYEWSISDNLTSRTLWSAVRPYNVSGVINVNAEAEAGASVLLSWTHINGVEYYKLWRAYYPMSVAQAKMPETFSTVYISKILRELPLTYYKTLTGADYVVSGANLNSINDTGYVATYEDTEIPKSIGYYVYRITAHYVDGDSVAFESEKSDNVNNFIIICANPFSITNPKKVIVYGKKVPKQTTQFIYMMRNKITYR